MIVAIGSISSEVVSNEMVYIYASLSLEHRYASVSDEKMMDATGISQWKYSQMS